MQQDIIEFWFTKPNNSKWFRKNKTFDREISVKFSPVHAQAVQCELASWRSSALGSLAEIIVLDQFSRNMFRGTAEAFRYDALALALAQNAIAKGLDTELTTEQKAFMYMPFMHSESLYIHQHAVELFAQLGKKNSLNIELRHQAIIMQFGRYPHRNAILGRTSTAEEIEFLATPGSSF